MNGQGEFTCPPVFTNLTDSSYSYGQVTGWQWDFGDGNSSTLQDPSNTYVFGGTYSATLSITDEWGCTDDTVLVDYLTISGPSGIPSWTSIGDICSAAYTFQVDSMDGVATVTWDLGDGTITNNNSQFGHIYDDDGSYVPVVTLTDPSGCQVTETLPTINVVVSNINAYFVPSPDEDVMGSTFYFDEGSTADNTIITWDWNVAGETYTDFSSIDFSTVFDLPGTYIITLTVTDNNGCVSTYLDSVFVTAFYELPNVITANDDGINDIFTLSAPVFEYYDFMVLNRWGNVIHIVEGGTEVELWDGTDMNGERVVEGVYFYKISGRLLDGEDSEKHGNITVIRD